MTTRQASCSCGGLTLVTRGEPVRISVCHCHACQRRTGSVFGAQARFARRDVDIDGESREYVRVGDSGGRISFRFCGACGSTVYYELDLEPGVIAVPVGAFADAEFPGPTVSVYESRRHDWTLLPADIDHHD